VSIAYFIDVQDTARLLVAATVSGSLKNERIFAYCHQATWNSLRQKIRDLYPHRPGLVQGEDLDLAGRDLSTAPKAIERAESILKEMGRPGFTIEDDILRDFVDSVFPAVE
jgi:hypothetical protein